MIEKLKTLIKQQETLIRYGIMAVIVVAIEYSTYILLLAVMPYILAVPISMLVGIILNWYFSGRFVFKTRRHTPRKEFALVFGTSILGIVLQTLTAFVCVTFLGISPLVAKLVAIAITFIGNYYIRKKYIF